MFITLQCSGLFYILLTEITPNKKFSSPSRASCSLSHTTIAVYIYKNIFRMKLSVLVAPTRLYDLQLYPVIRKLLPPSSPLTFFLLFDSKRPPKVGALPENRRPIGLLISKVSALLIIGSLRYSYFLLRLL